MKTSKLFLTGFILLVILQQLASQVPQGFKYQAVCRDNSGVVIQNQAVGLRLSIHDSQPEGIIVYQETFAVTTNQYGLITVDIGTGNVVSGNFALIPWAIGNKFLELELDLGSGFVSMGTSQLLSVPYALFAETAEHFSGELTEFDPVYTASVAAGISASDTAYWNSKLDVEMDGSVTNEIQFLSISQDTIHLTDGGFVKLPSQSGWLLNGNSGTLDGTNFIGTSDNVPLNFRVNNQKAGRIDAQSVVFIGYEAGNQNIAQNTKNTAIGYQALKASNNHLHVDNTAVGYKALNASNGLGYNTAIGSNALIVNTVGEWNTGVGTAAANSNTSGSFNTSIGGVAMSHNSVGNHNTAVGFAALIFNGTGNENTSVGMRSMHNSSAASNNVALGYESGFNVGTGSGNVFLGYQAGFHETGSNKLYIANNALNPPLIYGDFSTGFVGIGTTVPGAKLQIKPTVDDNSLFIISPGDDSRYLSIYRGSNGAVIDVKGNAASYQPYLSLRVGGSEKMTITHSGNIGIGTTDPTAKLDVWNGNISVSNGGVLANTGFWGDALRTNWGNDLTLQSSYENKGIIFKTYSGEKMWIDALGNVGIGKSNPSYKLDVNGDINSSGTLYASSGIINATSTPAVLDVNGIGNSSHIRLFSGQDNSQIFLSDYQGVMGIQLWHTGKAFFAGNVGIGTNSPSSILHLSGDSPKLKIQTKTNLTDPSLEFVKFGVRTMEIKLMDGGAGTGLQFIDQNSEQVRMYIKASTGHVGIGTIFPNAALDVNGQVKISGGSPGAGKVLTSDAAGLATWEAPASAGAHYIGEIYGGGIVFYVYDNGQHGLIAATTDQSAGIQWSNGLYKYTGTTGDGLGAGAMNTTMIVATQMGDNETGNFAAKICADYAVTANGVVYGDWYLPSKYESDLLYLQKDIVGGFSDANYWTSTEESFANSFAKHKYFGNGAQTFPSDVKYHTFKVRAIRAF